MKAFTFGAALVAVALLSGCRDEDGAMKPGIYETSLADGTTLRTVFKDDGTYVDMADNVPQPVAQGKWQRKGGEFCVESDDGQSGCFTETATADGFVLESDAARIAFRTLAQ